MFANDKGRLLPGMLMTIGIESNRRNSLSIAEQSLVPIETRQYVYVVEGQNKADRREVKTGSRIPGQVEILEGLKEGDSMEASLTIDGGIAIRPARWNRKAFAQELARTRDATPMGTQVIDELRRGGRY